MDRAYCGLGGNYRSRGRNNCNVIVKATFKYQSVTPICKKKNVWFTWTIRALLRFAFNTIIRPSIKCFLMYYMFLKLLSTAQDVYFKFSLWSLEFDLNPPPPLKVYTMIYSIFPNSRHWWIHVVFPLRFVEKWEKSGINMMNWIYRQYQEDLWACCWC